MDFSHLRTNDELSDVTVVVEGKEFNLHRFPLYACSDFFRQLAQSETSGSRVELADFPGGAAIFAVVADHCYGINVAITAANVCHLRCAAEFLGMTSGDDNLAARADSCLDNSLAGARVARQLTTPVQLLQQCCDLGETAEKVGIIGRCIDSIIDTWATFATPVMAIRKRQPQLSHEATTIMDEALDAEFFQSLCTLPVNWIVQLFVAGRDKPIHPNLLAAILRFYVANVIGEVDNGVTDDNSLQSAQTDDAKNASGEEEESKNNEEVTENQKTSSQEGLTDAAVREALDLLLSELPDRPMLVESVSPSWAVSTLKATERYGCRARPALLLLAARLFHRLDARALCRLTPELICELARTAISDIGSGSADVVCLAIDRYLAEMAARDALTTDLFTQVVSAVPAEDRRSHDTLFDVLETLLKSEQGETSTDEQKQHLMQAVDFKRLSESTLQRAYESDLVPGAYITKAALALCTKLRAELEATKSIVNAQAAELHRFGLRAGRVEHAEWQHRSHTVDQAMDAIKHDTAKHDTLRNESLKYDVLKQPVSVPKSALSATIPSLTSDLELQLALDALNKAYSRGSAELTMSSAVGPGSAYHAYRYRNYLEDRNPSGDSGEIYRHSHSPRYTYSPPRSFIAPR